MAGTGATIAVESLSEAAHARRLRVLEGQKRPTYLYMPSRSKAPATTLQEKKSSRAKKTSTDTAQQVVCKALPVVSATYLVTAQPRQLLDCFLAVEAVCVAATKTLASMLSRHVLVDSVDTLLSPAAHVSVRAHRVILLLSICFCC